MSGKFINTIRIRIQLTLKRVWEWACERELGVKPDKTKVLLFTKKYKSLSFLLLKFHGSNFGLKEEARFLGLVLDRKPP